MIFLGKLSDEIKALALLLVGDEVRAIPGKGIFLTRKEGLEEIEGVRVVCLGKIAGKVFVYHAMPGPRKNAPS